MKNRFIAVLLLALLAANPAWPAGIEERLSKSVVKIYVTVQRPDYRMPWQTSRPWQATGSGFVISGRRLLSNAHVVSDAKFIEIQKSGDARRYPARVKYIAHDCDLAMLDVDEKSFFDDTVPVPLSSTLPKLDDEVVAVGYPLGGEKLSITRGIVSRIDYSVYVHSGADQHLVLQVDAAINPGNSGGPVFFKDKVVGVAFSGIAGADNIGYAIPIPVIERFLADIADGKYDGYAELGVAFYHMRNKALRADLKLPPARSGVAICYVDPFGAAKDILKPSDVLLSVDGLVISDDGNVVLDGNSVEFTELMERKQWGAPVNFGVWRDGAETNVIVPLTNPPDPFAYRNSYDQRARYYIAGGLVFCPLSQEYLRTMGRNFESRNGQQLLYYARYAKPDGLYKDRDEFVVLMGRLPHEMNAYADQFMNGIVSEVNGMSIRNLKDLKIAFESRHGDFHVIKFENSELSLVMKVAEAKEANAEVLSAYGVPAAECMEE